MERESAKNGAQNRSGGQGRIKKIPQWISPEQASAISKVDHYKNSEHLFLDVNEFLNSYMLNFVEPLLAIKNEPRSIADIGTGYGWLAIAFALRTNAQVIAVERDPTRIQAAVQIASVLGVSDRIEWVVGSIEKLPFADRAFDAVYCIEVIEHTGTNPNYIKELTRVSNDILVITTPNKFFPVINHDTALPFCHWLPLWLRDIYASCFKRSYKQENNLFWSPISFLSAFDDFERISRFLQFRDYREYLESSRLLKNSSYVSRSARSKETYFRYASKLGKYSIFFIPNLASTFRRRQ